MWSPHDPTSEEIITQPSAGKVMGTIFSEKRQLLVNITQNVHLNGITPMAPAAFFPGVGKLGLWDESLSAESRDGTLVPTTGC